MDRLFFWLMKPDPGIPDNAWIVFLGTLASITAFVVLVTVVLTMLFYTGAASRRRVYFPSDLFAPYTPMRWILLALPGALVAGGLCYWQYSEALGSTGGELGVSLQIALLNGVLSALISYLLIAFVGKFTPAKFRYRPAPYRHKPKAAKAS